MALPATAVRSTMTPSAAAMSLGTSPGILTTRSFERAQHSQARRKRDLDFCLNCTRSGTDSRRRESSVDTTSSQFAVRPIETSTRSDGASSKPNSLCGVDAVTREVLRALRRDPLVEVVRIQCLVHDARGECGEALVVVAGVGSQAIEGFVHIAVRQFGDHPFCLFDYDSTVEGVTQLNVQCVGIYCRAVLKYGDCRHVGETLGHNHVVIRE